MAIVGVEQSAEVMLSGCISFPLVTVAIIIFECCAVSLKDRVLSTLMLQQVQQISVILVLIGQISLFPSSTHSATCVHTRHKLASSSTHICTSHSLTPPTCSHPYSPGTVILNCSLRSFTYLLLMKFISLSSSADFLEVGVAQQLNEYVGVWLHCLELTVSLLGQSSRELLGLACAVLFHHPSS